MRNFLLWLESQSNITIDSSNFNAKMKRAFQDLIDYAHDRRYKLQGFKLNQDLINKGTETYPRKQILLNALGKPYAQSEISKFAHWIFAQPYSKGSTDLRNAWRHLSDYEDSLEQFDADAHAAEVWKGYEPIIKETEQNMLKWKAMLEEAIARIPDWNGSAIVIEPNEYYEASNVQRIVISAAKNTYIRMGRDGNASFTLGYGEDRKGNTVLDIDDILEGGEEDEEFFSNSNEKRDYFNLINELKNPGSSSKKKMLTLYTARPVKDREFYSNTKTLPENIFLTNDYHHADGLATDLGSGETRDIWKVRIDSKYVTQTLDGLVKYYQVTTPNAPAIVSMY